jgi:hypothetical protein
LSPDETITLDLHNIVEWSGTREPRFEDRRLSKVDGGQDAIAAAKALLKRHLEETTEMLEKFG